MRAVWVNSPSHRRSRRRISAIRVSDMGPTVFSNCGNSLPTASSFGQPYISSAPLFHVRIRRSESMVITASWDKSISCECRRRSSSTLTRAWSDSRKLPTSRASGATETTKSPSPQIAPGSAMAKKMSGPRNSQSTMQALSRLAARPGPRPPNREAIITATAKGKYGTLTPMIGSNARRIPAAANTVATAKPYRHPTLGFANVRPAHRGSLPNSNGSFTSGSGILGLGIN